MTSESSGLSCLYLRYLFYFGCKIPQIQEKLANSANLHDGLTHSAAAHLVQPSKTHPYITVILLMGCKESNQANKQNTFMRCRNAMKNKIGAGILSVCKQ